MVFKTINKIVAFTVIFALAFEQSGFAQVAGPLGVPNYINGYVAADRFRPLQLRSLAFDELNNDFSLFLDKGDNRNLKDREIKENAQKLSEYFRIGLILPAGQAPAEEPLYWMTKNFSQSISPALRRDGNTAIAW